MGGSVLLDFIERLHTKDTKKEKNTKCCCSQSKREIYDKITDKNSLFFLLCGLCLLCDLCVRFLKKIPIADLNVLF
jgi:hypothetical protein